MNKEYIKRFFMLTEQNILGSQLSANDEFDVPLVESTYLHKRRSNAIRVGLISTFVGIAASIWVNFFHPSYTTTAHLKQPEKSVSPAAIKPVVQAYSKIPYYRDGANQQTLHQISLRKASEDINLDDEAENVAVVTPVVDKVIVVPKSFG